MGQHLREVQVHHTQVRLDVELVPCLRQVEEAAQIAGLGHPAGFGEHHVRPDVAGDRFQGADEIRLDARTEQTAAADLENAVRGPFQQLPVDSQRAELVDNQGHALRSQLRRRQQVFQQRRFSGTEVTGDEVHGDGHTGRSTSSIRRFPVVDTASICRGAPVVKAVGP